MRRVSELGWADAGGEDYFQAVEFPGPGRRGLEVGEQQR